MKPWTTAAGVVGASLLAAIAQAQTAGSKVYRAAQDQNDVVPCASLPAAAAKAVPPPFDRYMVFDCNKLTGQGLHAVAGFHWTDANGIGLGLSATKAVGPDAKGEMHFPFSWYVQLTAVAVSASEQAALSADFKTAIKPQYLAGATILELQATTSNKELKGIYLVVPDAKSGLPKWLIGLECDGACFREDRQPMIFEGEPDAK